MELAARPGSDIAPLVDRALMAIYRRQQELAWTEHLVQDIETEERGDQAAAEAAAALVLIGLAALGAPAAPPSRLVDVDGLGGLLVEDVDDVAGGVGK